MFVITLVFSLKILVPIIVVLLLAVIVLLANFVWTAGPTL